MPSRSMLGMRTERPYGVARKPTVGPAQPLSMAGISKKNLEMSTGMRNPVSPTAPEGGMLRQAMTRASAAMPANPVSPTAPKGGMLPGVISNASQAMGSLSGQFDKQAVMNARAHSGGANPGTVMSNAVGRYNKYLQR